MILFIPFESSLDRSQFDCGRPEMDRWFREVAGQQERSGAARTTLAVDEKDACIAGYFTLVAYRLEPAEVLADMGRKRRYPVPAVLIARLAVDLRYQGKGVGKIILFTALERVAETSKALGFEMVVVDAIDEDAVCFYLKHGFRRFADHSLKLFMTIKDLRATFANPG